MNRYLAIILLTGIIFVSSCKNIDKNQADHTALVELDSLRSFILDADTGNEMDDLYAIVRALIDPEVDLIALTSAHFNNVQLLTDSMWNSYPTKGLKTLKVSQNINYSLLEGMGRLNVPHPEGCDRMVGYSWGYNDGAPIPESDAVNFIIENAGEHSPENKLNILCVGPLTNVAAAILLKPGIEKNIRLFSLSMKYDIQYKAWNKNTFNARNDINALDLVLSNEDLELFIMPGNVSRTLTFERTVTLDRLSHWDHPVTNILAARWDEVNAGNSWIMWDLALVETLINPELASIEIMKAPPENGGRGISVFTDINEQKMREDFWLNMESFFMSGL